MLSFDVGKRKEVGSGKEITIRFEYGTINHELRELTLCQALILGCGTLRAPAMGVVFCLSFHALRTSERATRRRRLTPILSFDKALVGFRA
jgi:hypothetical protein